VFETHKLLIPESTKSLKSPEPTSMGTIQAQSIGEYDGLLADFMAGVAIPRLRGWLVDTTL